MDSANLALYIIFASYAKFPVTKTLKPNNGRHNVKPLTVAALGGDIFMHNITGEIDRQIC